jgi:hypothetical protein
MFLINIQATFSDDNVETLKKLLNEGLITEEEFKKASSKSSNSTEISNDRIKIKKSTTSKNVKFVKYEFYIDNYRIHTLGPGAIRADNLLTGETDVKIGGNFKSKFTNEGKKYFDLSLDKENLSAKLNYKGRMLINWSGKYVAHHSATFYQMQVLGYMPFHFYIMLKGKNPISLNIDKFNRKIEKAVNRVKEEMAIKFDISIEDIDKILERKNKSINNEIENIISDEKQKIIKELTDKYAGKEITDAIREEIEKTIGEEMANALISEIENATGQAIDEAVETELAAAINEAITYAVQMGVSEASAEAAIAAMLWVYANGGSDEEAMDACRSYAGDAC